MTARAAIAESRVSAVRGRAGATGKLSGVIGQGFHFRTACDGTNVPFMLPATDVARARQFPLFAGLAGEAWAEVQRSAVVREFARGQLLWTAGVGARGLFVIMSGAVRVTRAPA